MSGQIELLKPEVVKSPIPDSVLQAIAVAIVGKIGSGKTYTAKTAVEQFLREMRRVCIIDPTGAWWGVRLDLTGKNPSGFDVVIFGGDHGDIPITPGSGEKLGNLIGTGGVPQCIVDVSAFSNNEALRFLTDFFEELYRINKGQLTLVLDEADSMAPQNPLPEARRLQGSVNKIVRRGRIKGFRTWMITQRPQVIDKSVLSQVSTLIAMGLTSPADRGAILDWVKGQSGDAKAKEIVDDLPRLLRGTGYVWSPEHDILEKVTFPLITTWDSSKEPAFGDAPVEARPIKSIDLDSLRVSLSDPQVDDEGETEPTGRKAKKPAAAPRAAQPTHDITPLLDAAREKAFHEGFVAGSNAVRRDVMLALADHPTLPEIVNVEASDLKPEAPQEDSPSCGENRQAYPALEMRNDVTGDAKEAVQRAIKSLTTIPRLGVQVYKSVTVTAPVSPTARKMLDVIHSAYPLSLTFDSVALRAKASTKSSSFPGFKKEVLGSGEVVEHRNGRVESCFSTASKWKGWATKSKLDVYCDKLLPSYASMLRVIHRTNKQSLSREGIGRLAGVSVTSSTLGAGLRELMEMGLIVKSASGLYSLAQHMRE